MMFGKNTDIVKLAAQWIPENSLGAEIGVWRFTSFVNKGKTSPHD